MKQKNDDNYDIIDKIYLCFKDPNEVKYQYLIRKRKKSHLDYCKKFLKLSLNIRPECKMPRI